VVSGDDLDITYTDKTKRASKKEPDSSLTTTLTNYGVTKEALAKVSIDIKRQSSWQFWLTALAPFLAPLLLIAFFVWYLSRQVRGAGMQAFSLVSQAARDRPQRRNLSA
jgi:ATP-dependent Zn protease